MIYIFKEVKATKVKEIIISILKKKGWKKVKLTEQTLEGILEGTNKPKTMWVNSKKFNYRINSYSIIAKETKDFGGKEPLFIIEDKGDILKIQSKSSKAWLEIKEII